MVKAAGIPAMSLQVQGEKYFLYHHTPADTIERLDPEEVALNVAALAVMVYAVADLPSGWASSAPWSSPENPRPGAEAAGAHIAP